MSPTLIKWAIYAGILGALVLSLLGNLHQWRAAAVAAANSTSAASTCATANSSDADALTALKAALDTCNARTKAANDAWSAALAERDKATTALTAAQQAAKTQREKTYDSVPDCNAWANAPVCPAISSGLRPANE